MKSLLPALAAVLALALPVAGAAATGPASICVGDCQGTGAEGIGSLVTLVSIALGNAPRSACPHGIPDGVPVTVALLIQAVDNALGTCPGQTAPTATVAASDTPTPTPTTVPTGAALCPTGQHRACHSGSGRGGGYRIICNCVDNPLPVCVTAWGTRIPAGTTTTLYDVSTVTAPDSCAAHATVVSCSATGVLDPPGATGYPVCVMVGDDG
jgi:hypothetical protein